MLLCFTRSYKAEFQPVKTKDTKSKSRWLLLMSVKFDDDEDLVMVYFIA